MSDWMVAFCFFVMVTCPCVAARLVCHSNRSLARKMAAEALAFEQQGTTA